MNAPEHKLAPYALLIDALRLLPVQPAKLRDELGQARHEARRDGSSEVHGVSVPLCDLDELFIQYDEGAPRISRKGAAVLLQLFRDGAFEMSKDRRVERGVDLLEAYAEGRASIIGNGFWARPRRSKGPRVAPAPVVQPPTAPASSVTRYERSYRVTTHRLT